MLAPLLSSRDVSSVVCSLHGRQGNSDLGNCCPICLQSVIGKVREAVHIALSGTHSPMTCSPVPSQGFPRTTPPQTPLIASVPVSSRELISRGEVRVTALTSQQCVTECGHRGAQVKLVSEAHDGSCASHRGRWSLQVAQPCSRSSPLAILGTAASSLIFLLS